MIEDPFMNDPFFSEFFDNRRNLFNLNRLFNGNGNGNSTMPPIVTKLRRTEGLKAVVAP